MSKSDSQCDTAANSHMQPSEPNRAPTSKTVADDFHELPADDKKAVLKGLVDEIMGNLLEGLPEKEKDKFPDECFTALYEKLPWRSQESVAREVTKRLGMQELEGSPSPLTMPVSRSSVSLQLRSPSPPGAQGPRGDKGDKGEKGEKGPQEPPENHLYVVDIRDPIGGKGKGQTSGNGKGKGQTSGNGNGKGKASGKKR